MKEPVVILISYEQFDHLTRKENDTWETIAKWRSIVSLQGDDLSDQEIDQWRDRTTERAFSWDG